MYQQPVETWIIDVKEGDTYQDVLERIQSRNLPADATVKRSQTIMFTRPIGTKISKY